MTQKPELKIVSEDSFPKALSIPEGRPLTVKCPICGCNKSEINKIEHGEERDYQEDGFQNAYVSVEFIGKCSHLWEVQFCSNFDGKMYLNVTYENDGCKNYVFPLPATGEDDAEDRPLEGLDALFG